MLLSNQVRVHLNSLTDMCVVTGVIYVLKTLKKTLFHSRMVAEFYLSITQKQKTRSG